MNIKNFARIFIPSSSIIHNNLMRIQINREFIYACDRDLVIQAESDESVYMRIINQMKEQYPRKVYIEREKYDEYLKHSIFTEDDSSFDDYLFSFVSQGFCIEEYFLFNIYKLPISERFEFASARDKNVIYKGLNDIVDRADIAYKHLTYKKLYRYYNRECIFLNRIDQLDDFIVFMKKHGRAVLKKSAGKDGAQVKLIDISDINNLHEYFQENIRGQEILLEEVVQQSEYMSTFNPSTVNTIRVISFNTINGVVIPYCFLKTGRNGSFVDNGGQGGILVDIDPSNGIITTNGIDELGHFYEAHPDHGYNYVGRKIPDWQGLIRLTEELNAMFPSIKYISWDFAHTRDGWIVIEGNEGGLLLGPQATRQEGIKNRIISIIEQCDTNNVKYVIDRIK